MNSPSRRLGTLGALTLLVGLAAPVAQAAGLAAPPTNACAPAPSAKAAAQKRWDTLALMTTAKQVEAQGEADFHVKYAAPASQCLAETFDVAGVTVTAAYTPWTKAVSSTLLYRFSVARPGENSEILVLYDSMASYISKGFVFQVSEERKGVISWYAMFSEEPALADLKPLVEQIVRGEAKPLMAVTWPKGAKEGDVVAFDTDRLK